jgi:hypothetical protein
MQQNLNSQKVKNVGGTQQGKIKKRRPPPSFQWKTAKK